MMFIGFGGRRHCLPVSVMLVFCAVIAAGRQKYNNYGLSECIEICCILSHYIVQLIGNGIQYNVTSVFNLDKFRLEHQCIQCM